MGCQCSKYLLSKSIEKRAEQNDAEYVSIPYNTCEYKEIPKFCALNILLLDNMNNKLSIYAGFYLIKTILFYILYNTGFFLQ